MLPVSKLTIMNSFYVFINPKSMQQNPLSAASFSNPVLKNNSGGLYCVRSYKVKRRERMLMLGLMPEGACRTRMTWARHVTVETFPAGAARTERMRPAPDAASGKTIPLPCAQTPNASRFSTPRVAPSRLQHPSPAGALTLGGSREKRRGKSLPPSPASAGVGPSLR